MARLDDERVAERWAEMRKEAAIHDSKTRAERDRKLGEKFVALLRSCGDRKPVGVAAKAWEVADYLLDDDIPF